MNENLKKAIILYSAGNKGELENFLTGLSRKSLESLFIDLITVYFNDKNSSKLRELSAIYIAGYEPNKEKLGYNGYRQLIDTQKAVYCEVKPQNTDNSKKKLNGGGSFNDYTPERFEKHLKENPKVLTCGFAHGKLLYIFEFDFKCLENRLKTLIYEYFPQGERKRGHYLRSASFSIREYKDCESLNAVFIRKDIDKFRAFLSKELFEVIKKLTGR